MVYKFDDRTTATYFLLSTILNVYFNKLWAMESSTEMQQRHLEYIKKIEMEEFEKHAVVIQSFKEHCKTLGLNLNDEDIRYITPIGITACSPGILSVLRKDIKQDKEGLIDFNFLRAHFEQRPFLNGFFVAENFMMMAHPNFRRKHHPLNNFAPRFIDLFWNKEFIDSTSYISLDFDRVRLNMDNTSYFEEDTWYGAKFNGDIREIQDGTVKLVRPLGIDPFMVNFIFGSTHSLDIVWETDKEGIRVFKAEEFKTEEIKVQRGGKEYHPVKYLHAEFDPISNSFRHFDGALQFYNSQEYADRIHSDMNYNKKNLSQIKSASQKMFKINGKVEIPDWIELTSHFLTGNPLIFEYFEGKYPERVEDMLKALRSKHAN